MIVKSIVCCFLLHNFCMRNGEPCPQSWVDEARYAQRNSVLQQPTGDAGDEDFVPDASQASGASIRQTLLNLHLANPL